MASPYRNPPPYRSTPCRDPPPPPMEQIGLISWIETLYELKCRSKLTKEYPSWHEQLVWWFWFTRHCLHVFILIWKRISFCKYARNCVSTQVFVLIMLTFIGLQWESMLYNQIQRLQLNHLRKFPSWRLTSWETNVRTSKPSSPAPPYLHEVTDVLPVG